jgi:CheY-like chemotaxis protein
LAGNFRRVAQLGDDEDPTRPEGFPTADYFAQSAGSEYCQLTLSRAVTDRDPAVALGAIQALRKTAGRASLLGGPDSPQPLAEALAFPNRMVRIRAGLALAFARPTEAFRNYQNLMPVLSETLNLHAGARSALIVEPNDQIANDVAAALRAEGYEVSIDSNLSSGLRVAREQMTGTDVIFLGSDISDPNLEGALQTIQSDFQFAATPVVIITKKGDQPVVEPLVRENAGTAMIQPNESASEVVATVGRVSSEIGYTPVGPQQGRELAAEAIEALRLLALTSNTLFEPVKAQTALLSILESDDPDLRIAAAEVLSMLSTADAQQALAATAFNSDEQPFIRSTMFARLADSAKRFGNRLSEAQIETLVAFVISDGPSMELREAASQALGALSVPGNPASRIIRQQTGP